MANILGSIKVETFATVTGKAINKALGWAHMSNSFVGGTNFSGVEVMGFDADGEPNRFSRDYDVIAVTLLAR